MCFHELKPANDFEIWICSLSLSRFSQWFTVRWPPEVEAMRMNGLLFCDGDDIENSINWERRIAAIIDWDMIRERERAMILISKKKIRSIESLSRVWGEKNRSIESFVKRNRRLCVICWEHFKKIRQICFVKKKRRLCVIYWEHFKKIGQICFVQKYRRLSVICWEGKNRVNN